MNSLLLAGASLFLLWLGYSFYCSRLERLFDVRPDEATPAHAKYDGVDYIPAKNWLVLFGHHFSSIAGAGPIIGPIIALSIWGWGPAILWAVIGSVFIGGVHDFGSLIVSVKNGGMSLADIAESVISRRAKIIFSSFVWLALILVIAVFLHLCAETLVVEPKIVVPTFGLIAIAILVGYLLYNLKAHPALVTILGLTATVCLIVIGQSHPVNLNISWANTAWVLVLLAYCFIASVMPVNILLQPRDYISAYLLFFGVVAGYLGIVIWRPAISLPFYTSWKSGGSHLWPMLFVTVACGAISGFHALIASGTTSKQLDNQKDGRKIGYGAMLAEGAVAVLAVIAVSTGLKNQGILSSFLCEKGGGPVAAFGCGYGALTNSFLWGAGGFISILILNAFILTTLDTATRIGRYLTHELFGIKNRYVATTLVVAASGWLGLSGNWAKIWPIFGASNQLVAALALLVITSWLLSRRENIAYTGIPCGFMLITTIAALIYQIPGYLKSGNLALGGISVVLLGLAAVMMYEVIKNRKADRGF